LSSLTEDVDIAERITAATKNFNALRRSIFRNRKISLDIRSQLYLAITVNILLWGCDLWALKQMQLAKLTSFHLKCLRSLFGYTMFSVKEYRIRNEVCMEKTKLKPIETYITIRQLRFLTRIAEMPKSRLTRQVVNSQAVTKGKCSRGQQTTKRAYRDALKRAGLCD
jgi:hypothetical protein